MTPGVTEDAAVARIRVEENGPLIVRGPFKVVDHDGNAIDPGRRTIALCRCGQSRIRPFCDNTHKLSGFAAAGGDERA